MKTISPTIFLIAFFLLAGCDPPRRRARRDHQDIFPAAGFESADGDTAGRLVPLRLAIHAPDRLVDLGGAARREQRIALPVRTERQNRDIELAI